MIFAGCEYSVPLVGRHVRGVAFLDTGTVEDNFGVSSYRASVGVGVRWIVPLFGPVPISFDFAFPVAKDGNDDTQIFSFSLGWIF
jgi:outer membrane protein insertion porin family